MLSQPEIVRTRDPKILDTLPVIVDVGMFVHAFTCPIAFDEPAVPGFSQEASMIRPKVDLTIIR